MVVSETVPFAIETRDRVPTERYFDPGFAALEADRLWSRTWQMACRLEEIPAPGDFTTYEILDQSVLVVHQDDGQVRAFENVCRHRGVRLASGAGTCTKALVCPFHGWRYGPDGTNAGIPQRRSFAEHNLDPAELDLTPVRCETWGASAWINLDPAAPPLRECIEPFATSLDAWKIESLRTEWWYAARLPVNWKLAVEAFVEMYHVVQSHPQLVIPTRFGLRNDETFDPAAFVDADLTYLRAMSEGMAGMMHADDVRVAEGLRGLELPVDASSAMATWNRTLNDAVVAHHRARGHDVPDLNELEAQGLNLTFFQCFPHYFVLPMYSSASTYRFRPLGPEETLMEIWSLTRAADGEERPRPTRPEVWACDDPRWPPIPAQDFSNLPKQQLGLHARGLEYLRLSQGLEGHISNLHRVVDGFLAGLPHERLLPALRGVNVYPFEQPISDLGL